MAIKKHPVFNNHILSDHERKNFSILELLRRKGPITRADISKATDLNIVTVSNYINNFIEKGLVSEGGMEASSGGRKPTLVKPNEESGYAIGIDLGNMDTSGANMLAVLTDLSGRAVVKLKKFRPKESIERVIERSIELIEELFKKNVVDKEKIRGVGIGIGGVIDEHLGTVRDTTRNGTRTSYVSIKSLIEQKFGITTFLGNDATFAAFGEKMHALPMEVEDIVYMYSDVGSGIIIKGGVYCGAGGSAGEVRINYPANGDYISLSNMPLPCYLLPAGIDLGILNQAKKILQEGVDSQISALAGKELEKLTVDVIIESAKAGDTLAIELLEDAAVNLGVRVSYLINLFNPEVVIIGGGIEKAGSLILEPLRRTVRKWAFEESANVVKIIPAQLGEDSVAMGAASVVVRDVFIQAE